MFQKQAFVEAFHLDFSVFLGACSQGTLAETNAVAEKTRGLSSGDSLLGGVKNRLRNI